MSGQGEDIRFDLRHGQVTLSTQTPLTFDMIGDIAKAGKLLGVPANAILTRVSLEHRGHGYAEQTYEVTVAWQGGGQ